MHLKLSEMDEGDLLFLIFQILMEIFTFYIFLFLHKQQGHSVLVGRSMEAEEKPWMEHRDTPQSMQLEHLWGLKDFHC